MSGADVNLTAVVADEEDGVDSMVAGGAALIAFTEATLGSGDLNAARDAVIAEIGEAGMVDAAGVIGNFQRMVRIADSSGIPVDGRMLAMSEEVRAELGLNELASARVG